MLKWIVLGTSVSVVGGFIAWALAHVQKEQYKMNREQDVTVPTMLTKMSLEYLEGFDDPEAVIRACSAMWFGFDRLSERDQQNKMVRMSQVLRAADEIDEQEE